MRELTIYSFELRLRGCLSRSIGSAPCVPSWPTFDGSFRQPPVLVSTPRCLQALADDIRGLCSLIRDSTASNPIEWLRVFRLILGSESRPGAVFGALSKPREFVGEVSSFADLLFAKTDFQVWTWAVPCFGTLTVHDGMILLLGDTSRAVGCLALYTRENAPSNRRFHAVASKIPCFDTTTA